MRMKKRWKYGMLVMCILTGLVTIIGSGGGSGGGGGNNNNQQATADLAMSVMIDNVTAFVNMVDGTSDTAVTNTLGIEVKPGTGVYTYNGYVYTAGSLNDDNIARYAVQADNSLVKEAETNVFESGGSIPTSFVFVDDTKAYVLLAGTGELLVIDPMSLEIQKRIDLSAYALDGDGQTGGDDINPEPSCGVIRDGKLYLGLAQIDSMATYFCQGKASVLIIDVATDEIFKHITDDRTCCTGTLDANIGLTLDENNDIYVNNTASFGYYPGQNAGYLRINNGEDEFDPDYYFSLTDIQDLDVPGGIASYAYHDAYLGNGKLYTTLFVPALTSNPPDYVNDKNYQPYIIDLYSRTATKLDMSPTIGWSTYCVKYNNGIVFGLVTVNGAGLYRAGEDMPFITTEGSPLIISLY